MLASAKFIMLSFAPLLSPSQGFESKNSFPFVYLSICLFVCLSVCLSNTVVLLHLQHQIFHLRQVNVIFSYSYNIAVTGICYSLIPPVVYSCPIHHMCLHTHLSKMRKPYAWSLCSACPVILKDPQKSLFLDFLLWSDYYLDWKIEKAQSNVLYWQGFKIFQKPNMEN